MRKFGPLIVLGLNHEQQHQELLLMDILHLMSRSPLDPAVYDEEPRSSPLEAPYGGWQAFEGGLVEIGDAGHSFAFDNERPAHRVWLEPFDLAADMVTNREWLAFISDGGYARPARAAQIRDALKSLEHTQPAALFAVQLDERALFLAPWQKLLVDSLTPAAVAQKSSRGELRALATKWEGHASVDSVSYRLVRAFRTAVMARIFTPIFATCVDADEGFDWQRLNLETAAWTLLRDQPAHLLNPDCASWNDLLVAAADDVVTTLDHQGVSLSRATWGSRNTARIQHPFSRILPAWLGRWLNMPADQLPGDSDMPRVLGPTHGASERFVVSPGHEAEGIFHMPGGQSGHPLSPFYRAGHAAWVRGEPAPFLPGPAVHTLELRPL